MQKILCQIFLGSFFDFILFCFNLEKLCRPENAFFGKVIKAIKVRLRPILIISITTILGLMPFILYTPETGGGDIWNILAYATVGGLTTATFFTLFIIPVFYNFFERIKEL